MRIGPTREFRVSLGPSVSRRGGMLTLRLDGLLMPARVFRVHQMANGFQPIIINGGPLTIRNVPSGYHTQVVIAPHPADLPPNTDYENVFALPQYAQLPQLDIPEDGEVRFGF